MSYDLYFKNGGQKLAATAEVFAAYFNGRKNYKSSKNQAIYENETTGVYFIFNFGESEDEAPEQDLLPVDFNLNYFRPHFFGLEAEPELSAFVREFGLRVFDPQMHGMGDGEYSAEGFLRGWNAGNEFGYRAMLDQNPNQKIVTLPTSQIEMCWRWNASREELQKKLGDDLFVPRFMFINQSGRIKTTVLWPDGIPTAIPSSDMLLIPRKTILPKQFFRSVEDTVLVTANTLDDVLKQYPLEQGALPYRLPNYKSPPPAIVSRLRELQPTREKLEGVAVDRILNVEIVEKILGAKRGKE